MQSSPSPSALRQQTSPSAGTQLHRLFFDDFSFHLRALKIVIAREDDTVCIFPPSFPPVPHSTFPSFTSSLISLFFFSPLSSSQHHSFFHSLFSSLSLLPVLFCSISHSHPLPLLFSSPFFPLPLLTYPFPAFLFPALSRRSHLLFPFLLLSSYLYSSFVISYFSRFSHYLLSLLHSISSFRPPGPSTFVLRVSFLPPFPPSLPPFVVPFLVGVQREGESVVLIYHLSPLFILQDQK